MYEANFARIKKFTNQNKHNAFGLQLCLLAIYAEWEISIKSALDEILEICNNHKKIKFKLSRKNFNFYDRIISKNEFNNLTKSLFDSAIEVKLDKIFFDARNCIAHGDFSSYNITYEMIIKYIDDASTTLENFTVRLNEYIENQEYLEIK